MDEASARRRRHARSAGTVSVHELQRRSTPAEQASVSAIQARAAEEANALTAPMRIPAEELRRAIAERDSARAAVRPSGHSVVPPARRVREADTEADTEVHGLPPVRPPGAPVPLDALDSLDTPDVAPDPDPDAGPAAERQPEQAEPPRTPGRLITTIVLTLAAMVALGAVTAIGATRTSSQRLSPAPPSEKLVQLAGPVVVRPDRIVAELLPATDPSAAATTWLEPLPTVAPVASSAPLASREEATQLVAEFYGDLPLRPGEAFDRLAPAMQGDGRQNFAAAWREANWVDHEVLGVDDGALRVAVSVSRPRGIEVVRLVQRIHVRKITVDGSERLLIADAQLLAAHRE